MKYVYINMQMYLPFNIISVNQGHKSIRKCNSIAYKCCKFSIRSFRYQCTEVQSYLIAIFTRKLQKISLLSSFSMSQRLKQIMEINSKQSLHDYKTSLWSNIQKTQGHDYLVECFELNGNVARFSTAFKVTRKHRDITKRSVR